MRYKITLIIICLIGYTSCKKENMCDCVKSSGSENVIYHNLSNFNCIYLMDKIDLYITQSSNFEIKVEAGRNLQKLIKIELDGETLKVYNDNKCNWVRGYKQRIKVYISAPYFKHIKHAGLGKISSVNTIVQDEISYRNENSGDLKLDLNTKRIVGSSHGNGDTYLSGNTQNLEVAYNGTNYLYASSLNVSSYIYLHCLSIGHTYVNAPENGLMDVIIERSGNIYYKGNPASIRLTKKDKGNLIKE